MKNLEIKRVPESRKNRVKLLESVLIQLKTEFVGLDSIIDQLGTSIHAWYVTPEIFTKKGDRYWKKGITGSDRFLTNDK